MWYIRVISYTRWQLKFDVERALFYLVCIFLFQTLGNSCVGNVDVGELSFVTKHNSGHILEQFYQPFLKS
jgi:hypothetical protein